jgi:hypothetical protein
MIRRYWRVSLTGAGSAYAGGQAASDDSVLAFEKDRSPTTRRERELQWLGDHREKLRGLVGQWIALDGGELLAAGHDLTEVLQNAKRKSSRPFLHRVQEEIPEGHVIMGL